MGKLNKPLAQAPLGIAPQAIALRNHFPFGKTSFGKSEVRWRGIISPTRWSREYTLDMRYTLEQPPNIWVRSPDLHLLSNGRKLPHVYNQETQLLCLFRPGYNLWKTQYLLTHTVVPWVALWLYYFELWLVTNVWYGKGEHYPE